MLLEKLSTEDICSYTCTLPQTVELDMKLKHEWNTVTNGTGYKLKWTLGFVVWAVVYKALSLSDIFQGRCIANFTCS